ncbi:MULTISPECIES: hypothetical protein [Saccharopolyspora]|uniref:Uncharacterized protein n=1 Tax=Saccharopolyspora elongata TaxID=2530387 RepID=A0A4R4Y9U2_9PSEU|nr:hypothetical protein [Saccharopolyspora elongata]TDD41173.1 hypothetical protein E1288_33445 [Saccharopolyspora elongata]
MTSPQNPWQQNPNPQPAGYPQAPMGHPQQVPGGKPRLPGTVNFASILGLVVPPLSAVLSVISFVVLLVMLSDYLESAWSVLAVNAFFTVAAVVCAILWIVFSLVMRRGRGWARIALVVLAVLWLLYDLYSIVSFFLAVGGDFGEAISQPTVIIGMVQMFLVIVTTVLFLVLVFLKPSNDYFKAVQGR